MNTNIQKLIIALVWLALPMLGQAQFTYTTNSGAITITGYTGSGGAVVIPATINGYPVTSIGTNAFYNSTLTKVTIGNSVTSIGNFAFNGCTSLTSVTIPNSVTKIGNYTFNYCTNLMSVSIGSGVTKIGNYAFEGTALTSVTIPNRVTSIGQYAFESCANLTNVIISKSVTSIGQEAFAFCKSLTTAYFLGNAPPDNGTSFYFDPTTVYYLAGTTGWGSTFSGVPAVLWNPQAHAPGFTGGQFGFNLTGPTNAVIVVEACTNLSNPVWLPVATNTFSASGTSTFTDPSTQHSRFYRFRSP